MIRFYEQHRERIHQVGVVLLAWIGLYLIFQLALWLSDSLFNQGKPDEKNDLHGFVNVLFSNVTAPALAVMILYFKTGRLSADESNNTVASDVENNRTILAHKVLPLLPGINSFAAFLILTVLWAALAYYCQVLYEAMYTGFTDPIIADLKLSASDANKILAMVRGNFYLGSFFPLVAASAFVCGCFAKKRIGFSILLFPAFALYLGMNIIGYLRTGYPSAFQGVRIIAFERFDKPIEAAGDAAVMWLQSAGLFLLVVLILSLYGWLFTLLGYGFRWLLLLQARAKSQAVVE